MVPEIMKAVIKRDFPKRRPGRCPGTRWPVPVEILGLICILLAVGLAACGSGAGSSTSTGSTGSGGSGVGWTVNVKLFAGTLSLGTAVSDPTTKTTTYPFRQTTAVVVTVRDAAGSAAPKGTRICLSTTNGSIFVDELGKEIPVTTGCVSSSNDIGQLMGTYVPLRTGTDQVQASSMGGFGSATITVTP